MWSVRDPDGRDVVLTAERWAHVLDRQPHEEWFYRRGAGPSFWIRVVVHYERGYGLVVTAFPRRSFP